MINLLSKYKTSGQFFETLYATYFPVKPVPMTASAPELAPCGFLPAGALALAPKVRIDQLKVKMILSASASSVLVH